MHMQIRAVPAKSPADLVEFLTVLATAGINIEIVGGSNVEFGGEFALAVEDGSEGKVMRLLEANDYHPRLVKVHDCRISNKPGQLLACISSVLAANRESGQAIRDISVGPTGDDGLVPVLIYSERRPPS